MAVAEIITTVVAVFASVGIGYLLGKQGVKIKQAVQDKKLSKNACEVIDGERENKIEIDGKMIDVHKFKLRDEDDKEIRIDIVNPRIQNGKTKTVA